MPYTNHAQHQDVADLPDDLGPWLARRAAAMEQLVVQLRKVDVSAVGGIADSHDLGVGATLLLLSMAACVAMVAVLAPWSMFVFTAGAVVFNTAVHQVRVLLFPHIFSSYFNINSPPLGLILKDLNSIYPPPIAKSSKKNIDDPHRVRIHGSLCSQVFGGLAQLAEKLSKSAWYFQWLRMILSLAAVFFALTIVPGFTAGFVSHLLTVFSLSFLSAI